MSKQQIEKNVSHPGGILRFLDGLALRAPPALAKGVRPVSFQVLQNELLAVRGYIYSSMDIVSKLIW